MVKSTINKHHMRLVKHACNGTTGNHACNRTAMYGSTATSKGGCTTRQCCNSVGGQWDCNFPLMLGTSGCSCA